MRARITRITDRGWAFAESRDPHGRVIQRDIFVHVSKVVERDRERFERVEIGDEIEIYRLDPTNRGVRALFVSVVS